MEPKTIAVLFGGMSPEHAVSLVSAHSVLTNLNPKKYRAAAIGITRQGDWMRYYGDTKNILSDTWHLDTHNCIPAFLSPSRSCGGIVELFPHGQEITKVDSVFPVLHGKHGEDGTVQGLAELSGIPLVGCGTLSSALCMDKKRSKSLLREWNIPSPKSFVIRKNDDNTVWENAVKSLSFPAFVKPVCAGSSFGITKVSSADKLFPALQTAFYYDDCAIVEEAVNGFEVGCAILGNETLTMGLVDEIELKGDFFDYAEKYHLHTARVHLPARIDAATEKRVRSTAASAYRALGCKGFARVDLFITTQGEVVFNEVNTIPGFTPNSRYPKMMAGIGMSYTQILDRLMELAVSS